MALRYDQVYKIKQGDDLGDPTFWNPRWQDVDLRLGAAESQFGKFDAASQSIIAAGIDRINTTFQPLLNTLTTTVTTLQSQVNDLTTSLTTQNGAVQAQLTDLLDEAETAVTNLEDLGTVDGGTF